MFLFHLNNYLILVTYGPFFLAHTRMGAAHTGIAILLVTVLLESIDLLYNIYYNTLFNHSIYDLTRDLQRRL